jgi:hypothetical protein
MTSRCCLCVSVYPPIVATQWLGKNPPIVARQRLVKNPLIVARQWLGKNPPIVARQRLDKNPQVYAGTTFSASFPNSLLTSSSHMTLSLYNSIVK